MVKQHKVNLRIAGETLYVIHCYLDVEIFILTNSEQGTASGRKKKVWLMQTIAPEAGPSKPLPKESHRRELCFVPERWNHTGSS